MTNRIGRIIEISFQIGGWLYVANVFENRPTAIIIPDQGIVATTNLSPKPDSSTQKNRYKKVILPTEKQEALLDKKEIEKPSRTIFDQTGRQNPFTITEYVQGEPFVVNCRHQTVATRIYNNPK